MSIKTSAVLFNVLKANQVKRAQQAPNLAFKAPPQVSKNS